MNERYNRVKASLATMALDRNLRNVEKSSLVQSPAKIPLQQSAARVKLQPRLMRAARLDPSPNPKASRYPAGSGQNLASIT